MTEPGSLIRSRFGRSAAPNFHSFVINDLGAGIISGRFRAGSILPRDAELIDMYGVSRTVLREALKTLEAKGLVEARPKVGTRVAPRQRWSLFDYQVLWWFFEAGFDDAFLANMFSIRRLLESEAVKLAAKHRTADDIRMMYYWVQQLSVSRGVAESFALANLEVQRLILEASQNPMLRAALGVVEFTLTAAMPDGEIDDGQSSYYENLISAQRGLVAAIEKGDGDHGQFLLDEIIEIERQRSAQRVRVTSGPGRD